MHYITTIVKICLYHKKEKNPKSLRCEVYRLSVEAKAEEVFHQVVNNKKEIFQQEEMNNMCKKKNKI